ncbi:MAG: creatininase family protein [Ardenticatenaceae bacterium]|nr:creatininase family protein [Ardenticatenaceae bacterium]HBY97516.1 creatininase [Chloroflexota bacterium]
MRLQEMKWTEVKQYLEHNDLILVPVGATEQHGTHLPLGTDSYESIGWAETAAERTGTLVTPPLWFGWSPHHMSYPGTITLSAQTLTSVVYEVCVSLVYHGFKKVIVVNGHRETNLPPLKIAATRVAHETGALVAVVDPGYMGGPVGREMRRTATGGVGHADELETSMILHLQGQHLVDMEEATRRDLQRPRGADVSVEADHVYRPLTGPELSALTEPAGALGDPSGASADEGQRYHQALVQSLAEFIEQIRHQPVDIKAPPVPV